MRQNEDRICFSHRRRTMKTLIAATALTLVVTGNSVWAQAPAAHDAHHPPQATTPAPAPTPPPGQPGMGGMMGSMPMMRMMRMMDMMSGGAAPGMGMIDRVEGRIAFLRAELKITEAQAGAWNAFADALRANAKKLGEVRGSMMQHQGSGGQHHTLARRLDAQERWLLARLEGTRAIKTAFTGLYDALSDDQKKTADELLAPHMGMRTMSMMPGQMGGGQMPGPMQPGRMQPGGR
jgi:hypothetical protein